MYKNVFITTGLFFALVLFLLIGNSRGEEERPRKVIYNSHSSVFPPKFDKEYEEETKARSRCEEQLGQMGEIGRVHLEKSSIDYAMLVREFRKLDQLASYDDEFYIEFMIRGLGIFNRFYSSPNKRIRDLFDQYSQKVFSKTSYFIEMRREQFEFILLSHGFGYYTSRWKNIDEMPSTRRKMCDFVLEKWQAILECNPHHDEDAPENRIKDFYHPGIEGIWVNNRPMWPITNPEVKAAYEEWYKNYERLMDEKGMQERYNDILEFHCSKETVMEYLVAFYKVPPDAVEELEELLVKHRCDEEFREELLDIIRGKIDERDRLGIRLWFSPEGRVIDNGYFGGLKDDIVTIYSKDSLDPNDDGCGISRKKLSLFCKEDHELINKLQAEKEAKDKMDEYNTSAP